MGTNQIFENGHVQITMVELSQLTPNPFNQRTKFKEAALNELAASIAKNGVISPIMCRKTDENSFQIIYGERRFRASGIARKPTIPAYIIECDDVKVKDIALTENIQREDLTPMEEAVAYKDYIDNGKTVKEIALITGKTQVYIYNRLKFNNLIPEFVELLENDKLNLSIGEELSKYDRELQNTIYTNHYSADTPEHKKWFANNLTQLKKVISSTYSNNLSRYNFDMEECLKCPFNTRNFNLFPDEEIGSCTKKSCLEAKNNAFLMSEIETVLGSSENMIIYENNTSGLSKEESEKLKDKGYIFSDTTGNLYPEEPEMPRKDNYSDEIEFQADLEVFYEKQNEYSEELDKIRVLRDHGKLQDILIIDGNTTKLGYKILKEDEKPQDSKESAREKLINKRKRNDEIALEKTVDLIKKEIETFRFEKPFSELEEKLFYLCLMSMVRVNSFDLLGIKPKSNNFVTMQEKLSVLNTLSDEDKVLIKRESILTLIRGIYSKSEILNYLFDFAKYHMPEKANEIQRLFKDEYEKKNKRIDGKLAELDKVENPENKIVEPVTEKPVMKIKPKEEPADNSVTLSDIKKEMDKRPPAERNVLFVGIP